MIDSTKASIKFHNLTRIPLVELTPQKGIASVSFIKFLIFKKFWCFLVLATRFLLTEFQNIAKYYFERLKFIKQF